VERKVKMAKKVIVIGGGISGLVAGIYALKAGFEVDICESHVVAGGLCSGWERDGYLVAGAVQWMTGTKTGSDLHEIWEHSGAIDEDIELCYHNFIAACPDGGYYRYLFTDLLKLEDEFNKISPEDEQTTKELVRSIKMLQRLPIPATKPMELMEEMEKAISFAPYIKTEKMLPVTGVSIGAYVARFKSPIIRDLLFSVVPNANISVQTLLKWLATNCNSDAGFPITGFGAMIQRVKNKFEKLGGKIFLKSKVRKISITDGVVTGVEMENGKMIESDYIISTISPDILLNKLLYNKYADSYFEKRFNAPDSFPTLSLTLVSLMIDFDMNKFPHTLYFKPLKAVFINNTEIKYLKINHYGYSPAFCKNGKTLAEVLLHSSEFEYWRDLKTSSPQTYMQVKEKIATHIIAEIEAIYPEIRGKISLLDVATPLTFQHYTGNFRGSFMPFCTMPHTGRENHNGVIEGVKNLYLAGQWIFPDGGLPMAAVAGKFAVQRICNQENKNIDFGIEN
jgi:phytoene dehydrogenase-like protein